MIDDLVVATDDDRIVEAVEAFGGTAVMTDTAHATGTDRVAEVAADSNAGFVVVVMGDEPLIDPRAINDVIKALKMRTARSVMAITTVKNSSTFEDIKTAKIVIDKHERILYMSRLPIPHSFRGDATVAYRGVGLIGFAKELLLKYACMDSCLEAAEGIEQLRLIENGYKIQAIEVDHESSGVNVSEDVYKVEKIMERKIKNESY
jgi:3-deoxy-manno-octulosonate cytidylyltransferase (CMP-KDO synthetase)